MSNHRFVIGALEGDHVSLTVYGYETPKSPEPKDANWLSAEISVSAGAWSGRVREAFVSAAEIRAFTEAVEKLSSGDAREANFEPMEPHLILKLSDDGPGRLQVSGVAFDQPEGLNAIAFNWQIEPKQLKSLLKQLKEIEAAFPLR